MGNHTGTPGTDPDSTHINWKAAQPREAMVILWNKKLPVVVLGNVASYQGDAHQHQQCQSPMLGRQMVGPQGLEGCGLHERGTDA